MKPALLLLQSLEEKNNSLKFLTICVPVTTTTYFNRKSGSLWLRFLWTICKGFSGFSLRFGGVFNAQWIDLDFLRIFQAI